jgi:hypothetical protein
VKKSQQRCYDFPTLPCTLAGFEPGSSALQADLMTTSPGRCTYTIILLLHQLCAKLSRCFALAAAGLPDGKFQNQKSQFGQILEGLAIKDVGIFYGRLVYFTAICYILWSLGISYGYLVYFSLFWYVVSGKIWQPCAAVSCRQMS